MGPDWIFLNALEYFGIVAGMRCMCVLCMCVTGGGGVTPFWECQPLLWAALNWAMGCGVLGPFVWVIRCDNTETKADSWTQQVAGAALFLALGQGSWGPELTVLCCGEPSWACQNQLGLLLAANPERCAPKHNLY